jgi:hypothetical protein
VPSFKATADILTIKQRIKAENQSRCALLSSGVPSSVQVTKKRSTSKKLGQRKGFKDGDSVKTAIETSKEKESRRKKV